MDGLKKRAAFRMGARPIWATPIAAALLVALVVVILSQTPQGNPIQRVFHPTSAKTTATNVPSVASPTLPPLSVEEIVARSRSAHFRDMTGTETIKYGDGGSTKATIVFTANPSRADEVDSQFNAQGGLVEIDHQIKDGSKRYLRTIRYQTNPPTDSGWKLDPQPVPDPRPLSVFLLDAFNYTAALIGAESINGMNCYHLQVHLNTTAQQEIWIRADNFYFAQWKETDSFSQGVITMTAWDTGASISLPSV